MFADSQSPVPGWIFDLALINSPHLSARKSASAVPFLRLTKITMECFTLSSTKVALDSFGMTRHFGFVKTKEN